jgi:hypothetical protein
MVSMMLSVPDPASDRTPSLTRLAGRGKVALLMQDMKIADGSF